MAPGGAPGNIDVGRVMTRQTAAAVVLIGAALMCGALSAVAGGVTQATETVNIRAHVQNLHVYGSRGGTPVIVSSGDGGWIHLGPHVAELLAARGYFVVGFDVRAYLASFTSWKETLRPADEPGDYKVLADFAARGSSQRPVLVGVSEGAGLSVLAATEPRTRAAVAGVVALGLPNVNELAWRWRDALIYVTHGTPNEPSFSSVAVVRRLIDTPLAAIHSTHDEFVPLAEAESIVAAANQPKRMWVIKASDHRFSDNQAEFDCRLLEAIAWVRANARQ